MTLKKLQVLRRQLTIHDYRYYVLNDPTISDQAYDMLYKEYENGRDELIGKDTRSLERKEAYPQWVQWEYRSFEPLT
jgi:NAD-dependent DNA ligase